MALRDLLDDVIDLPKRELLPELDFGPIAAQAKEDRLWRVKTVLLTLLSVGCIVTVFCLAFRVWGRR